MKSGRTLLPLIRQGFWTVMGNGIRILLSQPSLRKICETGPVSQGGLQHNRIEITLPNQWKKGQTSSLSYRIETVLAENKTQDHL